MDWSLANKPKLGLIGNRTRASFCVWILTIVRSSRSFRVQLGHLLQSTVSHFPEMGLEIAHKSACRAGDAPAQMLPSQEVYAAKLVSTTGFSFA
ncbi:hypothetical protein B0H11DRAFT_118862 [Mycena galericulata]|nr:hypothetical protein B0H11DRAFT_118862 [Mycena galericulata]